MKAVIKKWRLILLSLLILALIPAFDIRLVTRFYTVTSEKINTGLRIALITDLHSSGYGKNQAELIAAIDRQSPDVLLFGGDICDDIVPHDNTELLLKGVADQYPCYYVTGNHEYWSDEVDAILGLFRAYGVTVLNDSCALVVKNGQAINICGIPDPDVTVYTDDVTEPSGRLEKLAQITENGNFTLLRAHRPELIDEYAEYGFDLVLSGHAHGGQWRVPFILNGLYAPNQGFLPQYAGGKYTVDGSTLIVSRGLAKGSTVIPRIFNRPELVVVDLIPASE